MSQTTPEISSSRSISLPEPFLEWSRRSQLPKALPDIRNNERPSSKSVDPMGLVTKISAFLGGVAAAPLGYDAARRLIELIR